MAFFKKRNPQKSTTPEETIEFLYHPESWRTHSDELLDNMMMTALIYYGLTQDDQMLPHLKEFYKYWMGKVAVNIRIETIHIMAKTVEEQNGKMWMGFFPAFMLDDDASVIATAATEVALLKPILVDSTLDGPAFLAKHCLSKNISDFRRGNIGAALLLLGDKRFISHVETVWNVLETEGKIALSSVSGHFISEAQLDFLLHHLEEETDTGVVEALALSLSSLFEDASEKVVRDIERSIPYYSAESEPVRTLREISVIQYIKTHLRQIEALKFEQPRSQAVISLLDVCRAAIGEEVHSARDEAPSEQNEPTSKSRIMDLIVGHRWPMDNEGGEDEYESDPNLSGAEEPTQQSERLSSSQDFSQTQDSMSNSESNTGFLYESDTWRRIPDNEIDECMLTALLHMGKGKEAIAKMREPLSHFYAYWMTRADAPRRLEAINVLANTIENEQGKMPVASFNPIIWLDEEPIVISIAAMKMAELLPPVYSDLDGPAFVTQEAFHREMPNWRRASMGAGLLLLWDRSVTQHIDRIWDCLEPEGRITLVEAFRIMTSAPHIEFLAEAQIEFLLDRFETEPHPDVAHELAWTLAGLLEDSAKVEIREIERIFPVYAAGGKPIRITRVSSKSDYAKAHFHRIEALMTRDHGLPDLELLHEIWTLTMNDEAE